MVPEVRFILSANPSLPACELCDSEKATHLLCSIKSSTDFLQTDVGGSRGSESLPPPAMSVFFQTLCSHIFFPVLFCCSQAYLCDVVSSRCKYLHNCVFIHYRFPPSFLFISTGIPLHILICHLDFFLILLLYSGFCTRQIRAPRTQVRAHSPFQKASHRNSLTMITIRILRIYIKFNGGFFFFSFQHNKLREKIFFRLT